MLKRARNVLAHGPAGPFFAATHMGVGEEGRAAKKVLEARFWHYLRAAQCTLARGTLACGAGSAGLRLRPTVGCSLTAPPTLAAPGRGGTRAWRGVPR